MFFFLHINCRIWENSLSTLSFTLLTSLPNSVKLYVWVKKNQHWMTHTHTRTQPSGHFWAAFLFCLHLAGCSEKDRVGVITLLPVLSVSPPSAQISSSGWLRLASTISSNPASFSQGLRDSTHLACWNEEPIRAGQLLHAAQCYWLGSKHGCNFFPLELC